MKKIILLIVCISFFCACKKSPSTLKISGCIIDPYQNIHVPGVKVRLLANGIVDGIYNSTHQSLSSCITDNNGNFSFAFDESAYDAFRLVFEKDNYYYSQADINSNLVKSGKSFFKEYNIYSMSYISLHVKNTSPFDDNDKIFLNFTNNIIDDNNIGFNAKKTFFGIAVDTTFECNTVGSFDLILSKNVLKNGVSIVTNDTIRSMPFLSTKHEVFY